MPTLRMKKIYLDNEEDTQSLITNVFETGKYIMLDDWCLLVEASNLSERYDDICKILGSEGDLWSTSGCTMEG